jgi:hypothetical protein
MPFNTCEGRAVVSGGWDEWSGRGPPGPFLMLVSRPTRPQRGLSKSPLQGQARDAFPGPTGRHLSERFASCDSRRDLHGGRVRLGASDDSGAERGRHHRGDTPGRLPGLLNATALRSLAFGEHRFRRRAATAAARRGDEVLELCATSLLRVSVHHARCTLRDSRATRPWPEVVVSCPSTAWSAAGRKATGLLHRTASFSE